MVMPQGQQPNVPILGQKMPTHMPVQLSAIPRELDENGLMAIVEGKLPRDSYVDARELVEMLREVVREVVRQELAVAIVMERMP